MFEIQNRNTLQSKNNVCKSDVKIRDCAHSLAPLLIVYITNNAGQLPKRSKRLSAMPEVRGTADTDGGVDCPSSQSSSYSLTTLSSSSPTDRRAVTDMNG